MLFHIRGCHRPSDLDHNQASPFKFAQRSRDRRTPDPKGRKIIVGRFEFPFSLPPWAMCSLKSLSRHRRAASPRQPRASLSISSLRRGTNARSLNSGRSSLVAHYGA